MRKFLTALALLSAGACWGEPSAAPPPVPWLTDVKAARESALREGRPCVLILHLDSSVL